MAVNAKWTRLRRGEKGGVGRRGEVRGGRDHKKMKTETKRYRFTAETA